MAMIYGMVGLNRGLRLSAWNPSFPVLAGDEHGGQRKYEGTVEQARLCAGEAWEICVEPGADQQARRRLARAAEQSQRVRASATVVSTSDEQRGPTRIVTFSDGPLLRNVTLGQQQRALVLRVRTPRSGPNGLSHAFVLPESVRSGARTSVVATFSRGSVEIMAESRGRTVSGIFRPPFRNSLGVRGSDRTRLGELFAGRALLVGAVVQFAALGLAVGWIFGHGRPVTVVSAAAVALIVLWVLDADMWGNLSTSVGDRVLAAVSSALGAALSQWDAAA
jgi:hypothetical protein